MGTDKPRLDEQTVALRVSREFEDGMIVNLGGGLPTLACNFIPEGREILLHSENGMLGFGPIATTEEADWDLFNASLQPVTPRPGMSLFDHDESFAMIRGGHVDLCVLGAFQVSEKGDVANWSVGDLSNYDWDFTLVHREDKFRPAIGGAMDLAVGAKKLIVAMTHTTKGGVPKIVKECTYEVTGPRCVSMIVTDVAVIEVTPQGLLLKEMAPGWSVEEVQEITEPVLQVAPDLKEIEL
jgi:3-oxoacid CoA-transferase subunit B